MRSDGRGREGEKGQRCLMVVLRKADEAPIARSVHR